MREFTAQFRSLDRPSRMLMINQFGINMGFYMLMPYLAAYLAGTLGLAVWAVGLVLGVRNFSQQGMFVVGGTLADRIGYKPLIVAGCLLRTGGFALLVIAHSLPALLIASAATGFAGALFNPAVRAYLAADAGDRRVEAFAVFNIFYQAGILLGPLAGVVLIAVDFRVTAAAAAAVFAVLTVAQLLALPQHSADPVPAKTSIIDDWRVVLGNRSFVLFAAAMIGSYILSFQVYLALPLQASILTKRYESLLVAGVFVVSGLVAVAGQLRITGWFAARWGRGRSLAIGVAILAASFLPLTLIAEGQRYGTVPAVAALLVSAAMLAVGSAAVFPFEMDTVVTLAGGRLVATHYGFYNTIVGVGILAGNMATGWLIGAARQLGVGQLVWAGLVLVGIVAARAVHRLDRAHHLEAKQTVETRQLAREPASQEPEAEPEHLEFPKELVHLGSGKLVVKQGAASMSGDQACVALVPRRSGGGRDRRDRCALAQGQRSTGETQQAPMWAHLMPVRGMHGAERVCGT
ncbi:MDR family MFS transporter [Mycobacterium intracellulare]|uniref:MFS transporter n=1 Tax=Mycobacterium intracellulare subsp. chimaera TaxID=222805 RepID=A0ABT7PA17_MYCIT|nr:MFS transporter [Mycobacterium intracellulare]ASQ89217.1 MFS transporter [Mycobacterium intracellulare subsp. chimaera]MCF1815272.1 MFS transporter [Mycobacterium intracellulare subsp. intracellulare]MDM3930121.1 MFS transporter [Mycobacterium intracellulare subsp. chimaera]MDS0337217.1 MFS transporter [Mycobacterium intracellulare]